MEERGEEERWSGAWFLCAERREHRKILLAACQEVRLISWASRLSKYPPDHVMEEIVRWILSSWGLDVARFVCL